MTGAKLEAAVQANKLNVPLVPREPHMLKSFFVLGAASDVSFNGLVLCVPYLRRSLGDSVLMGLGLCQFGGSVSAMALLFWQANRSTECVTKPNMAWHLAMESAALCTMLVLNSYILVLACSGLDPVGEVLYPLVFLSGAAGGTLQSVVALHAGLMTKFTVHSQTAAAQMSGHGFGIVMPTVLQLCLLFLPSVASVPSRAAAVSAVISILVLVAACAVLLWLQRQHSFVLCREGGVAALTGSPDAAETVCRRLSLWSYRRGQQLLGVGTGLALNMSLLVYSGQLTPFLRVEASEFWQVHLPTLLLASTNLADFLGRTAAARSPGPWQKPSVLQALLLMRATLVLGLVLFARGALPFAAELAGSILPLTAVYVTSALASGLATVGATQFGQAVCMRTSGPNMDQVATVPCPLAAQLMWLATMAGCIFGTCLAGLGH